MGRSLGFRLFACVGAVLRLWPRSWASVACSCERWQLPKSSVKARLSGIQGRKGGALPCVEVLVSIRGGHGWRDGAHVDAGGTAVHYALPVTNGSCSRGKETAA
jgi:hypothetical protein